jgi:hypothetical protein
MSPISSCRTPYLLFPDRSRIVGTIEEFFQFHAGPAKAFLLSTRINVTLYSTHQRGILCFKSIVYPITSFGKTGTHPDVSPKTFAARLMISALPAADRRLT